jgi:addiction module HigA family antidote
MTTNKLLRGLKPMHPGELLREVVLPAIDKPKTEIVRLLGISRQSFYDILDEKQPVTPVMALRFGKLFGNGPDIWLNMQRQFDIAKAQREFGPEIAKLPTLKVA